MKKKEYISEVAKYLGLHEQTIRKYEREGLIKPARTEKNTRYFVKKDIQLITIIITLTQETGMTLNGVKILFELAKRESVAIEDLLDFVFEVKKGFEI